MKPILCHASLLFLVFLQGSSSMLAQSTSDLVNDQIAAHFNQVFSDETSVYAPERSSWVPGNDKDTQLLGSVWSLSGAYTQVMESSIEQIAGHDVSVQFGEVGIRGTVPLKPRHKVSFAFNTTFYGVDEHWSTGSKLLPLEQAKKVDLGFMYRYGINPRWELLAGGGISHTDADVSTMGGKSTLLGYAGAAYTVNPNLTFALALSLSSREFHGDKPFPLFVMDWRINDRHRLTAGDGLLYQYALNKAWKDVLGFEIDGTVISLHMDSREIAGAYRTNPVYVIENVGVALIYSHTFQNGLILTSRIGVAHVGRHGYWDNDEEFAYTEFKESPGLGIGLRYRF